MITSLEQEYNTTHKNTLALISKEILDFHFGDISFKTIESFIPENTEFQESIFIDFMFNFGFHAIQKEIKAGEMEDHFLPCVIFDKHKKPYVYLKTKTNTTYIYDPINNKKLNPTKELLCEFNQAIILFKQKKTITSSEEKSTSWFWQPIKSCWRSYIEIGILTFFINIFALIVPLFTMNVYDRVIPNNALDTLFVLLFGVLIILGFDLIFKTVRNYIIEKTGKKIGIFLEEELMRRVLLLENKSNYLMTGSKANLFRELHQIRDFFAIKSIIQIIDFPFFFLALLVIFMISPLVALVPAGFALFIIFINILMQIPISNLSKKNTQNIQSKHNFLIETIQATQSIKLSNAVPSKLLSWKNIVVYYDAVAMKIQSLSAFSMNLSQTSLQLVTIFVVVAGVFEIINNNISIGALIALTILSSKAMVPIINLSMMVLKFKEIKESLNTINSFWHLPQQDGNYAELGMSNLQGNIEFNNVTFFFENSKYPSLENFNIKIKSGEKVGILGQTGSGKSTIFKLLTNLYQPTSGSIYLDGHDLSTLHPVEVRQNIGMMVQEPFIFNGTLKENIELSHPINKEKMMELIKLIGLEEFVKKSGQGPQMQVGEQGAFLSVGQKHLISLARALIHEPNILILDEPTTGLDIGLEQSLVNQLKGIISEDKTLIVITHRLTALDLVDRLIVLNHGKIVADGPKKEVLKLLSNNNNPKGIS